MHNPRIKVKRYHCAICGAEELAASLPPDWCEAGEPVCDDCVLRVLHKRRYAVNWLTVLRCADTNTANADHPDIGRMEKVAVPLIFEGLLEFGEDCIEITKHGRQVYKNIKANINKLKREPKAAAQLTQKKPRGNESSVLKQIPDRLKPELPYKRDDIIKLFAEFMPGTVSNAIYKAAAIGLLIKVAYGEYVFLEPTSEKLVEFSNDPLFDFLWPGRVTL